MMVLNDDLNRVFKSDSYDLPVLAPPKIDLVWRLHITYL